VLGLEERLARLEGRVEELSMRVNDLRHTLTVYSAVTWAILAAILTTLLIG